MSTADSRTRLTREPHMWPAGLVVATPDIYSAFVRTTLGRVFHLHRVGPIPMTRNPVTCNTAMQCSFFGLLLSVYVEYTSNYIYTIGILTINIVILYNIIVYRRRASHSLWYCIIRIFTGMKNNNALMTAKNILLLLDVPHISVLYCVYDACILYTSTNHEGPCYTTTASVDTYRRPTTIQLHNNIIIVITRQHRGDNAYSCG